MSKKRHLARFVAAAVIVAGAFAGMSGPANADTTNETTVETQVVQPKKSAASVLRTDTGWG